MPSNSSRTDIPEAKETVGGFKMGVVDEIDVPLTNGYNDNLASIQDGSAGSYMVEKVIEAQECQMAGKQILPF